MLDLFQVGVIKGNAGELAALFGSSEVLSKGVDSVGSGFKDPVSFVRDMAKRERESSIISPPMPCANARLTYSSCRLCRRPYRTD